MECSSFHRMPPKHRPTVSIHGVPGACIICDFAPSLTGPTHHQPTHINKRKTKQTPQASSLRDIKSNTHNTWKITTTQEMTSLAMTTTKASAGGCDVHAINTESPIVWPFRPNYNIPTSCLSECRWIVLFTKMWTNKRLIEQYDCDNWIFIFFGTTTFSAFSAASAERVFLQMSALIDEARYARRMM